MSKREIVLVFEDVLEGEAVSEMLLPRLTPLQYSFLRMIAENPGINTNQASLALGRNYSSGSGSVRTLVRMGFVERQEDLYFYQSKGIPLFVTASGRRHLNILQEAGL